MGNHDLYLINSKGRWKNSRRSMNRIIELKALVAELEGVVVLDGSVVTIDGIIYGGTGM